MSEERVSQLEAELEQTRKAFAHERSTLENRIAELRLDYEELLNEFRAISEQRVPLPDADEGVTTEDTVKVIERQLVHYAKPHGGVYCGATFASMAPGSRRLTTARSQVTCPRCIEEADKPIAADVEHLRGTWHHFSGDHDTTCGLPLRGKKATSIWANVNCFECLERSKV